MRTLLAVAVVFMCGGSADAAEYGLDTWTAGAGSSARTFVFKMQGDRFVGVACGPCDDPSTVVRIVSGTTTRPGHVSFSIVGRNTPSTSPMTLRHVGDDRTLIATVKSEPAPKMARLDGRWVASGRNAQQNFTLKLRDGNTVWGVVCGPCDKPEGVFLLDDGTLDGDAISFFIHHVDNRRNWMRGVVTGNVMKFKWVREGHESEPGGEITMIGPVR
jgi:hypothetical protein